MCHVGKVHAEDIAKEKLSVRNCGKRLLSIQCLTITFVSLSVFVACVVAGVTMFFSQLEALNAQALQTRLQLRDRFKDYVDKFVKQGPSTMEFIYNYCYNDLNTYDQHFVNKKQQAKARQVYTKFIQATPEITGVFHGNNANGDIYGVQKTGENIPFEGVTGAGNMVWEVFLYNLTTGDRTTFRNNLTKSDVRTRAWWVWAKAHPGITLMPSFFAIRAQQFAISTTATFYNRTTGSFITSFQVQFSLDSISRFLANMQVSNQTRLFLLDMDSNYIGTNVGGAWNFANNKTSMEKVHGANHTDLIVRDSFKALVEEYGGVANIDGFNSLTFVSSDGETRFMELMPIKDTYGLRWLAGVVVSSSEINKPLYNSSIIAVCVCLVIIIAFPIAISIFIGCTLMPLNKIIAQMNLVEKMQLDSINTGAMKSFLYEVYSIQSAFFLMVLRLKEYKAFLPGYIIDRDFGREEEEEGEDNKTSQAVGVTPAGGKSPTVRSRPSSAGSSRSSNSNAHSHSHRMNGRRMSNSSTVVGNIHGHGHGASLALGLEQKEVSILLVKVENLNELFAYYSPSHFVDIHGKILEELNKKTKATKGDLTRFSSEWFLITWNAATAVKSPAVNACNSALTIRVALDKLFDELHREQSVLPTLSMTITTDMAYVGNVGSSTKRAFYIIGTAMANNNALASLHKIWPGCIVTDTKTLNRATSSFEFRSLPSIEEACSTEGVEHQLSAYDLREAKKQKQHDEWMYELKQSEEMKTNKYELYELGCIAMRGRNYKDAHDHFENFLRMVPHDPVARKLLQTCTINMP